jgi:hypothetical protein
MGIRRVFKTVLLLAFVAGGSALLPAQSLVNEALSSFPAETIRVEYSHPAVLRSLPNYNALRERYEGPRLQELEDSFSKLGIEETDVDELVLGWQAAGQAWRFYGLTSGRLDAQTLAGRSGAAGVASVSIDGQTAYCVGAGTDENCLVMLGPSLGAFGSEASLRAILAARAGAAPGLATNSRFRDRVREAESPNPIWGVATGPAVPDWFRGWMPNQTDLKLDWSQAFKAVEALTYNIDPGDTVRLNVAMDCTTSADAASLRQVFEGLRLFQQLTWQNQYPGRPNPYKNLQIQAHEKRVSIELDTPYSNLMLSGALGGFPLAK